MDPQGLCSTHQQVVFTKAALRSWGRSLRVPGRMIVRLGMKNMQPILVEMGKDGPSLSFFGWVGGYFLFFLSGKLRKL